MLRFLGGLAHSLRRAAPCLWVVAAIILAAFWPMAAQAQHTSLECPPQSATVSAGGSVTIDITDCASSIAFAGIGDVDGGSSGALDFEDHGEAILRITGSQWFLDYSHNGSTGIGSIDVFEFTEATATGNGDVRVTITITPSVSPISVAPGVLPTLTAGTPFSQALSSSGGVAPYAYTLQGGALPPGLSLSGAGVLSGTPTQRGAYSFSVRSTDATTQFVDKGYTGTVLNPSLSLAPNTGTAIQGVPFSQALNIVGGVSPYACQLESGALPAGINVLSTCELNGTTNAAPGDYTAGIRITDASTGPGSWMEVKNFTITVSPPPSVSIAVSQASVEEDSGAALTYTVTRSLNLSSPTVVNIGTTGTAAPGTDYTGGVATVTIPAGATVAAITITPTVDAVVEPDETVTLTVATGSGYAVGATPSVTGTIINDDLATLAISDVTVTEGNAGTTNATFTVSISAPAGPGGVTFDIATADGTATAGSDYVGQSLTAQNIPAGSSTYTFTVVVNGDTFYEPNETFFVNVTNVINAVVGDAQGMGTILNDDVPVVISPAAAPGGTVASPYSQTFTASGGAAPYTYAVTAGALPPGLSLAPNGVLAGMPMGGGAYNFTITATDSSAPPGPYAGSQPYSIMVAAPTLTLLPASLPGATRTVAYSSTLTASGGTTPYSYAVTAGALPAGLTLSSAGVLSGTPTVVGSFSFSITATDSSTGSGPYLTSRLYTLEVAEAAPVASDSSLTVAYGSSGNPVTLSLSGGPPTSLAITTAAAHGTATVTGTTITYTPHAGYAGPDSFACTATNAVGTSAAAIVSVTVSSPTIVAAPAGPESATVGVPFSRTYTWSGGTAPYTGYQVHNLPAGLSVTATTATTATVSGTPTVAGTFNLILNATDSSTGTGPFQGGASVTLTVAAPVVTLTLAALPDASAYTPYSQALSASGGVTPHSFAVTAGSLPSGLSLSTAGVLSGTPGGTGTYTFTVTATDNSGNHYAGSHAYTLQVQPSRTYTGPSPTGGGTITASFTGGGAACVFAHAEFIPLAGHSASPPAGSAPQGVQFPYGLFDFATTGCTPGATLEFTITYPNALPGAVQYWKYGPTSDTPAAHWYTIGSTRAGNAITFSVTDGGTGDDDLGADGAVADAGGPGFTPGGGAVAIPMGSGLMGWLTLTVMGAVAWQRRRAARERDA